MLSIVKREVEDVAQVRFLHVIQDSNKMRCDRR